MRLVDADALLVKLKTLKETPRGYSEMPTKEAWAYGWNGSLSCMEQAIIHAPDIEAAPVVHGEWGYVGSSGMYEIYACNQCGTRRTESMKSPFCPGCGANMVRKVV